MHGPAGGRRSFETRLTPLLRMTENTWMAGSSPAKTGTQEASRLARRLAEIPEQAGHDGERLLRHRQQDVFVGGVLRAARIGMRHPDRRQAEALGEHVIG